MTSTNDTGNIDSDLDSSLLPGMVHLSDQRAGNVVARQYALPTEAGTALVTMLTNPKFAHLPALLAEIRNSRGEELWAFKADPACEGLVAQLALSGSMPVVAILEKGRQGQLVYVRTFGEILSRVDLMDCEVVFDHKVAAATYLGRQHFRSPSELELLRLRAEALHVAAEAQRQAEEADRAAAEVQRVEERNERVQRLLARLVVTAYTAEGVAHSGIPVVNREWESLPSFKKVIRVESYNDETGDCGAPIEAFTVVKVRGKNPQKRSAVPVTSERPGATNVVVLQLPQVLGHQVVSFTKNGARMSVTLFGTTADARQWREAGRIITGWYAAYNPKNELELYTADGQTVAREEYEFLSATAKVA